MYNHLQGKVTRCHPYLSTSLAKQQVVQLSLLTLCMSYQTLFIAYLVKENNEDCVLSLPLPMPSVEPVTKISTQGTGS